MKTLLVPVSAPGDNTGLRKALTIARLFGAHIECCYVRQSFLQLAAIAMPHGQVGRAAGEAMADRWEELQEQTIVKANEAQRSFMAFCRRNGLPVVDTPSASKTPSCTWLEMEGNYLDMVVRRAWFHDLIVLGRSQYGHHTFADLSGEVLLRAGRPLLLAGTEGKKNPPDSILVAWKAAPQAVRAVAAAIPLLRRAKQVTIATAVETGMDHERAEASASQLAASLIWHDIHARVRVFPESAQSAHQAILAEAAASKANLLVMGGYGHSRAREWVFGGLTRQIVNDAPLDVFLMH